MKKTTKTTTETTKPKKTRTTKKAAVEVVQELVTTEVSNVIQEIVLQETQVIKETKPSIFESTIFSNQYQEEIYIPKTKKSVQFVEL